MCPSLFMYCNYGKNKERRQRRVVFKILTTYYVTNRMLKKYADPVRETVQNIFKWHYLNVFSTVFKQELHIFAYKNISKNQTE